MYSVTLGICPVFVFVSVFTPRASGRQHALLLLLFWLLWLLLVVPGDICDATVAQERTEKRQIFVYSSFRANFCCLWSFLSQPLLWIHHKHTHRISTLFEKLSVKREIDSLSMLIELDQQLRNDLCLS